jgi:tRNA pseudouridine38-40 synthase
MSRTFKLLLAYDGTDFVGWQRQSNGVSIQGLLEEALAPIAGRAVSVVGAGRTDAGVHATGQVASVRLETELDGATLRRALNAMLPPAVRVMDAHEAADDFHARFGAIAKTYHYRIFQGPVVSPFACRFGWHLPYELDAARMAEAAALFEGTFDFAAFQSAGSDVQTTVRTVTLSRVSVSSLAVPHDDGEASAVPALLVPGGGQITYAVTGTGFLRHMVRAIVGTLVEVGRGRLPVTRVARLLDGGSRDEAGATAPACGLCLAAVGYEQGAATVAAHR